jgi:hypothetical protein
MPGWEMNDPLDLKAMGIEKEFQREYRRVIAALDKGEKGSITMKLEIKRDKDMETMVDLSSSITSTVPARKRKTMGRLAEGGICIEAIQDPVSNLVLFNNERGAENDG